jgi:hypothetical protein
MVFVPQNPWSLREKRGLDGFSVCPSTVHSWKTDTRRRPAHTLEDYGLTIAVRLILRTVEIRTAKYVEPVTLLLVYLGYY